MKNVRIIDMFSVHSSLSTSLNSMSAVVLEDFYKPFFKRQLTDRQANWLMKGVVVGLGALSLGKSLSCDANISTSYVTLGLLNFLLFLKQVSSENF